MSRVVIQGDASGTGDFTIAAPNSNTDRTLTLPDEAGEVLVNGTTSKVGIGTSSPDANGLTISSAGGEMIHLISSHATKTFIEAEAGNGSMWRLGTPESNPHVRLEAMYPTGDIKFITNSLERMLIDDSGRVTMPYQPSFHAHANADLTHGTTSTKYVWNLTRHNIGNHYDTTTGRFTAPVAGRYLFNISALQNVGATSYYTRVYLYKNGAFFLDGLNSQALQSGYQRVHIHTVVEAAANDYFETYFLSNGPGSFAYAAYSWFSGHLLG
jgi:hypothetical protein